MHSQQSVWQVDIDAVVARLEEMMAAPELPPWKRERLQGAIRNAHARHGRVAGRPVRP